MRKILLLTLLTVCLCYGTAFAVEKSMISEPKLIGKSADNSYNYEDVEKQGNFDFVIKPIYSRVTSSYYTEEGSYSYSLLGGYGVVGEAQYSIMRGMEIIGGVTYIKGNRLKSSLQECDTLTCKTTYNTEDKSWSRASFHGGLQQNFPVNQVDLFVGGKISYNRFYGLGESEIDNSFGFTAFSGVKFLKSFSAEMGLGVFTTRKVGDIQYSPTLDHARNTGAYNGASEFYLGLGYSF